MKTLFKNIPWNFNAIPLRRQPKNINTFFPIN